MEDLNVKLFFQSHPILDHSAIHLPTFRREMVFHYKQLILLPAGVSYHRETLVNWVTLKGLKKQIV